jgi:hypothetical protein
MSLRILVQCGQAKAVGDFFTGGASCFWDPYKRQPPTTAKPKIQKTVRRITTAHRRPCAADTTDVSGSGHQEYELADGAKLTTTFEADRPTKETELVLLTRLVQTIERSEAVRLAG